MCAICDYLTSKGQRGIGGGAQKRFVCPIHTDSEPSLTVWHQPDDHWKCFGCGRRGDLVALIRYAEFGGLDDRDGFKRAFRRAEELGHVTAPFQHTISMLPMWQPPNQVRRKALWLAAEHYRAMLERSSDAQRYLAQRGVDMNVARELHLGFCPGTERSAALLKKSADLAGTGVLEELVALGLLNGEEHTRHPGKEVMFNRLIIPNLRGDKVVWMQGRWIGEDDKRRKRYLSIRGPKDGLYGWESLSRSGPKVIVEGFFDWTPFYKEGYGGIAIMGNLDEAVALVAARLAGQAVVIARDRGKGGRLMDMKVRERLAGLVSQIKTIVPPPGCKDPNEWEQRWGMAEIIAAVEESTGEALTTSMG